MGRVFASRLRRLALHVVARWHRLAEWFLIRFGPRVPLSFKLAVPVLATTAVVALVLGSIVTGVVRTQIETAFDRQADMIAEGVEVVFVARPNDISGLNLYLTNIARSDPDLISVRVHSLQAGAPVIASSNPAEIGQSGLVESDEMRAIWAGTPRQDNESTAAGPILQTVRPLRAGALLFGAVVITSSTAREGAATRALTMAIGAGFLAAIVLEMAFTLAALSLGILRPARRLQRAIKAVEKGDTSVRLEEGSEPPAHDEMFNLARQVDHMIVRLDDRRRVDAVIRMLGQRALEGVPAALLMGEGLAATRQALGLSKFMFARVDADGKIVYTIDDRAVEVGGHDLPVWLAALVLVSVRSRKPVLTDRLGQDSRFAEAGESPRAPVAIVPLPRTEGGGEAIIATAPLGAEMPEGALAMLESVAATIAEAFQRQKAGEARYESAVKSKVMAAMSHEMRNPLNSILGFTALILTNTKESLTEKQRRQLGFVQTSANNMLSLVTNALDLAKTRSGSLALQLEPVTLAPVIQEVVATMRATAVAKQVTIRVSVADDVKARVDAPRCRQMLTNLVGNAIKFTPEGGRVSVRARADKDSVRVVVSDTGVGIARDQQRLVFTEFAKIDAGQQARSKGIGLGLALTKGFVEAMGGTITFLSRPGRGTTFVVKLQKALAVEKPEVRVA